MGLIKFNKVVITFFVLIFIFAIFTIVLVDLSNPYFVLQQDVISSNDLIFIDINSKESINLDQITNLKFAPNSSDSLNSNGTFNSILELFSEVLEDKNILISIKCANEVKVNLNVMGASTGEDYNLSQTQIDCNNSLINYKIQLLTKPINENELIITTNIDKNTNACYTCEMSSTLDITNINPIFVVDPTILLIIGLIVMVLIVIVVFNILFNQDISE